MEVASKALDAVLSAACKKILFYSSKNCSKAVWGDLGIESLNLRRNKRKVYGLNEELGRHSTRNSNKAFFVSVNASL